MPERYCSGKFSKQRGDVIHKSTYGKNILILVKSPSGRVKDRVMLTKQKTEHIKYIKKILEKKGEKLKEEGGDNKKRKNI